MIRPGLYWLRLSPDSDEWTVGRLTFDGVRLRLYVIGHGGPLSRVALRLVVFGPRLTGPPAVRVVEDHDRGDENDTSATTARKD